METIWCSLCRSQIYPGHGSMFVKNNLTTYKFCRSKCSKLFHMKKNPFFLRWTKINREIKGLTFYSQNEASTDPVFLLKKSKNYNSHLILQTLYQLKRIEKSNSNRKKDYKFLKKNILKIDCVAERSKAVDSRFTGSFLMGSNSIHPIAIK